MLLMKAESTSKWTSPSRSNRTGRSIAASPPRRPDAGRPASAPSRWPARGSPAPRARRRRPPRAIAPRRAVAELRVQVGRAALHERVRSAGVCGRNSNSAHRDSSARVDLEVRVLGGGADQRDQARLHHGQQRVLLRLVEAVDLVEEQDRAAAVRRRAGRGPAPITGRHVRLAHLHRRQLLELRAGGVRDDPRERRLPGAGRAVEDRGRHAILLDRPPQRACRGRSGAPGR